ncbi:pyrroline-5-carboxylate reductase [Snodgrassella sp. B3882]|uniref:pyrroline-5-carboxylate reductase n=1 Tax=Snodgrassella sp. B3882 TaxID=2818037 RepID=UPI002269D603|nr:pyrroline-5-carboxylate reductase [Snodgrassella sp. B3882]MCX8745672.1 pyrroline-5-carboxylate reductase [Snodgrassella sp. B3882]
MRVFFLGGGNMATAIVSGMSQAGGYDIEVIDRNQNKRQYLIDTYQVRANEALPELNADDVLVLAVKPQDMQVATANIRINGALILSLAAGLTTSILSKFLHGHQRIIRIMPNTPCQIGLGISGLFAPATVDGKDKAIAEKIMLTSGSVVWLDEESGINRIAGISGSGPAYVFYFLNALQQAAIQQGFSAQEAHQLSLGTFKGAVALAEKSGLEFNQLQKNVTSKGGTTFAATSVFDQHKLTDVVMDGVQASIVRAEEMQQQLTP